MLTHRGGALCHCFVSIEKKKSDDCKNVFLIPQRTERDKEWRPPKLRIKVQQPLVSQSAEDVFWTWAHWEMTACRLGLRSIRWSSGPPECLCWGSQRAGSPGWCLGVCRAARWTWSAWGWSPLSTGTQAHRESGLRPQSMEPKLTHIETSKKVDLRMESAWPVLPTWWSHSCKYKKESGGFERNISFALVIPLSARGILQHAERRSCLRKKREPVEETQTYFSTALTWSFQSKRENRPCCKNVFFVFFDAWHHRGFSFWSQCGWNLLSVAADINKHLNLKKQALWTTFRTTSSR